MYKGLKVDPKTGTCWLLLTLLACVADIDAGPVWLSDTDPLIEIEGTTSGFLLCRSDWLIMIIYRV